MTTRSIKNFLQCLPKFILGLEFPVVAILVLAGMLSAQWLPAGVAAAAFFWMLRWVLHGWPFQRTPADGGLAVLLLTLLVTIWVTVAPQITLPQVLRLLGGIALFYAVIHWANSHFRVRAFALAIAASGLLLALSAPVLVEWPARKQLIPTTLYQHFVLLVNDSVNANTLAASLVLLAPIPLSMLLFAWSEQRWYERLLSLISTAVMLTVLALTQSRGAWLAVTACLVVLVGLRWRWGWLVIVLAAAGAFVAIDHYGASRFAQAILAGTAASTVEARFEIWLRAFYMIQDFPLTGIGMGNFDLVAEKLYFFGIHREKVFAHAHNLFLQIAVDLGIPGLIAWLSILFTTTVAAWQAYRFGRRSGVRWLAGLSAGLMLSQLALVLHGLTDAVTWGMVRSAPVVWLIWGLAVASANLTVTERQVS